MNKAVPSKHKPAGHIMIITEIHPLFQVDLLRVKHFCKLCRRDVYIPYLLKITINTTGINKNRHLLLRQVPISVTL